MKDKKKILVVGGTGFLGYHLCKEVLKKGWTVSSLSTKKPLKTRKLKRINYLICDIRKKKNLLKLKKNYNYVVNFGGYVDHSNKKKTYESHFIGCKNLADYFQNSNIESFVQMGSCLEYGNIRSPQKESSKFKVQNLKSCYGKSKLLATSYLMNLYEKKKFPVSILRLYLAYGPHQDINRFIPIIINGCLRNHSFETSNGKQKRDFIYISDVIDLILKIFKNKKSKGQIFNVGSGKSRSIKKIIEHIKNKIKKGKPIYGRIKLRKDEILNLYPNITKTTKILNWKPKISFAKGLNKTINFYKLSIK